MSETSFTLNPDAPSHSMGLLGASVTAEEWRVGGIGYLNERRLREIERRILALEARGETPHAD